MQTAHELDYKKIDKNRGAVVPEDLSQDVKEMMTGGSVAVVGEGAVGMVNLNTELSMIVNDWREVLTNER